MVCSRKGIGGRMRKQWFMEAKLMDSQCKTIGGRMRNHWRANAKVGHER